MSLAKNSQDIFEYKHSPGAMLFLERLGLPYLYRTGGAAQLSKGEKHPAGFGASFRDGGNGHCRER